MLAIIWTTKDEGIIHKLFIHSEWFTENYVAKFKC